MNYEEKYNEILEWARKNKARLNGVPIEEVLPELAESEDEKIRRTLVEYFGPSAQLDFIRGVPIKKIRAWLEKQKEHQNNSDAPNESSWSGMISSSDKDKNLDEIAQDYVDGVKEYNPEPTWDLIQTAVCYGYHYCEQKEQKPVEWSEEDEEMLEYVIGDVNDAKQLFATREAIDLCDKEITWLKSLRPHWKPGEEQDAARRK